MASPPCRCGWSPGFEPRTTAAGRRERLWPSEGARGVWWLQKHIICGEGDWYGHLMKLRGDQKRSVYRWYEHCGHCGRWRYKHWVRSEATGGGKTTFMAGIEVLEMGGPPEIAPVSPIVVSAANSWDQANLLFGTASIMCGGREGSKVEQSPLLGHFEVYDAVIQRADGRPGRIVRVAAIAGTNEGGQPSLFVCDEAHELGDVGEGRARMHVVIGKSTNKRQLRCEIPGPDGAPARLVRRGPGRVVDISTAGFDVDHSFFGGMYKHARKVIEDPGLDPGLLAEIWEAPEDLDFESEEDRYAAVAAASPAAGILWDPADRVAEWGKPEMPKHEWGRYYANRWEKIPEDSWLKDHPAAWGRCRGSWVLAGDELTMLAVDMSLTRDSTAVDELTLLGDGRIAVTARIWEPGTGRIDHKEVFGWARERAEELGPRFAGLVYDPRFFELPAIELEDAGIQVVQFDQTPVLMAPACGETYDAIIGGQIVHAGDPEFGRQVLAAARRMQDRGTFTLSKGKSKRRIDACIAMCMGVYMLRRAKPKVNWVNTVW